MRRTVDCLLRGYGSQVMVCKQGQSAPVRAFLQPITSRSWQNMEHMFKGGGEIPRGKYLYIGPAEVEIEGCDYLQLEDKRYRVRRCDIIRIGDTPLYRWALCVEGGYDATWND